MSVFIIAAITMQWLASLNHWCSSIFAIKISKCLTCHITYSLVRINSSKRSHGCWQSLEQFLFLGALKRCCFSWKSEFPRLFPWFERGIQNWFLFFLTIIAASNDGEFQNDCLNCLLRYSMHTSNHVSYVINRWWGFSIHGILKDSSNKNDPP